MSHGTREIEPRPGDQRPRGRSARVRRVVLDSALAIMAEEGASALSMDAIAARAGVHKTTLYRRWGAIDTLLREALEDYDDLAIQQRPVPDLGSFEADLRGVARTFGAYLERPMTKAVLRMIVAESAKQSQLSDWAERFWVSRSGPFQVLIDRAVARGELPQDTHAADIAEPLVGPMLLRVLVTGYPLDEAFLDGQAALVFRGLYARKESP